jgi:hypothetical protein
VAIANQADADQAIIDKGIIAKIIYNLKQYPSNLLIRIIGDISNVKEGRTKELLEKGLLESL